MPHGETDALSFDDVVDDVCVRVLTFSVLRDHVGDANLVMVLPEEATGETLLDEFFARYPEASDYRPVVRLAVNEQYVPLHTRLRNGDDVALITPVSGG
jgi:molybdopterin converting factor small subunit